MCTSFSFAGFTLGTSDGLSCLSSLETGIVFFGSGVIVVACFIVVYFTFDPLVLCTLLVDTWKISANLCSPATCSSDMSFNSEVYLNSLITSVSSDTAYIALSNSELPGNGTSCGKIVLCL